MGLFGGKKEDSPVVSEEVVVRKNAQALSRLQALVNELEEIDKNFRTLIVREKSKDAREQGS